MADPKTGEIRPVFDGKNVEYKVRKVERFIVTKYSYDGVDGRIVNSGSQMIGEYGSYETGYAVAYALCKETHEQLGYQIDDNRIQYPEPDFERIGQTMENAQVGDTFG